MAGWARVPQRSCTTAAAAGATPVMTWYRLGRLLCPPTLWRLLPPRRHCNPHATRRGRWTPLAGARDGTILPHMCAATATAVGRSVPRREGADKVTGRARYTDDLVVPGAWYGKTVRSTVPRGRLRAITLDPEFDWGRVVVITAVDIPGENVVHLIRDDQPVLARIEGEIRDRKSTRLK